MAEAANPSSSSSDPPKAAAAPAAVAAAAAQSYSTDPALYIYTSLTAGSSHIVTATSRLETILRANRVPFKALDVATDDKARMLWGRRAGKDEGGRPRKLPGLVQMGMVLGDLVEIEDWNEYGELKQHVSIYYDEFTQPPISQAPKPAAARPQPAKKDQSSLAASSSAPSSAANTLPPPAAPPLPEEKKEAAGGDGADDDKNGDAAAKVADAAAKVVLPIRSIAEEAAAKAKQVRLQGLREKVYGKGGKDTAEDEKKKEDGDDTKEPSTADAAEEKGEKSDVSSTSPAPRPATPSKSPDSTKVPAGMQSPTTGTWRDGASTDNVLRTLQSPTTTSWKPTDVGPPITSHRGSLVTSPSEDEIAAIERAETIEEEEEEEEEEDEATEAKD